MKYRCVRSLRILCVLLIPVLGFSASTLAAQESTTTMADPAATSDSGDEALLEQAKNNALTRYLIDTGPLRVRDQFLLGMGFLAFDPGPATVLPKGKWQVDAILTVTNSWANSQAVEDLLDGREQRLPLTEQQLDALDATVDNGIFHLDGEVYRTALAIRQGIGHRFQLELTIPVLNFRGGSLDSLIEGTHDFLSLEQAGRLGSGKDDFLLFVTGPNTHLFADQAFGTSLGDIVLGAKYGLIEESPHHPWTVSVEGLLKLPTGDEDKLASSGSVDLGVQVQATRYFQKSCLHGSLGILSLGDAEKLAISSQTLLSGMLAYERLFTQKSTVLLQLTVSQTPFDDLELPLLSKNSIQATLGYKRALSAKTVLLFGFTENIQNFNNTADIGFHLGWTAAF